MQTTVAEKLNISLYENYIKIPRHLDRLLPSVRMVIGEFFSFSSRKVEGGSVKQPCTRTYTQLASRLGLSVPTVWRAINKSKKYITKGDRQSEYSFDYDMLDGEEFDRIEQSVLLNTDITLACKIVFARIRTICDSEKNKSKTFESSDKDLAEQLGLSKKTIKAALGKLNEEKLVFCIQKGVNKYKKSVYTINEKRLRKMEKSAKKEAKRREHAERTYYDCKHSAEDKAERLRKEIAENNPGEYEELETLRAQLIDARISKARAEQNGADSFAEAATVDKLERRYGAILKKLGVTEEMFRQEYYMRCDKCRQRKGCLQRE